jgi:multiple RNA-binding domain-containing protein 1
LVKNIPFETEVDELKRLFGKFGHLRRVCLPPAKTMAIVEYVERTDAEKGFTGLAFKKFKHVPLYLEWAPKNVFNATPVTSAAVGAGTKPDTEEPLDEAGETGTLFVKNLNFETTAATLRKVFETVGPLRTATVARKKDPKNPGAYLSMGYGFVEYINKADCVAAAKALQGREIDGHAIQLKISNRGSEVKQVKGKAPSVGDNNNAPTTKIIVKNLAFEATKKELRELFATFGQVKSCRIPRKFDGTHRGFGFVDFLTKQEAKNAFEALQSSHFYGRHLVLKWATEEDSLEMIRKKAQDRFPGSAEAEEESKPTKETAPAPNSRKRKG